MNEPGFESSVTEGGSIHLVVEHPHSLPRLVAVTASSLLVGRGRECAIVLDDEQVSREHAMFLIDGDRVVIRDLGSHNGTYVNGAAVVGDITLSDDDLVSIGRARLAIRRNWSPPDQKI
jgi:pSer/pThr/pTyr-binding forkhead associated (FHA) protein